MQKRAITLTLACMPFFFWAQKIWSLRACVDYALENNLQVITTQYSYLQQKNNLQIAKNEALPTVSASLNNNFSFGQTRDFYGSSQRNDNFNNSASINAQVLVYNHGRLQKNIRKTEFDLEASLYDVEKIKQDISLQIAELYLQILLNKEILSVAKSALENAEKQYNRTKITTETGTTAQQVLAESKAALAREKQNVKNAEINIQRSLFNLAQLLRIEDYETFEIADAPKEIDIDIPSTEISPILNIAFVQQPGIKAQQARINAAKEQINLAKTSFWPTISANIGLGSNYFNSLVGRTDIYGNLISEQTFFQQYRNTFGQQASITASIPIFNKGNTRLQVESGKIAEDAARNQLALSKQEVYQNIQRAQFDLQNNYENYLAAEEAAISTQSAMDYAEKSFNAGRTTIYDLNIARNNYANAMGSMIQAKYNYIFSQKLLDFYSGIPLSLD